jgi:alanyl-tRNA synthetase
MNTMTSAEIRQAFLDYFVRQGHTVVASSSLVPAQDPTLLFINAGMVQFKDVFLGLEHRDYRRAVTSQKCMRVSGKHNDLENVGPSSRHHTFFEMLGNFSFGDYFKREAIGYAWEFLAGVLGLPEERLYPTIYVEDEEAFELWQEVAGVEASRITRLGEKDNFWAMGDTGPCGPCSEVIYDRGVEYCTCGLPDCNPASECERWWELWNLVFMQFERDAEGRMTPLAKPGIDTGMGLERITAVMQGVDSNYQTDLFQPIMRRTQELLGDGDAQMGEKLIPYRVVADHGRAITFLIGDGVRPGNKGRDYVLRMILRRAARFGKKIGFDQPFLTEIARVVIENMGDHYTDLRARQDFILSEIAQEEERFHHTLDQGLNLLSDLMADLAARDRRVIPGDEAFKLYDTYGFPLDLSRDVAAENGFDIDEAGYQTAMEEHIKISGGDRFSYEESEEMEFYSHLLSELKEKGLLSGEGVQHVYDEMVSVDTTVIAILRQGQVVSAAKEDEEIELVLPVTPFYVESGGQISDTGLIACCYREESEGVVDWEVTVEDMRQPVPGLIIHVGRVLAGTVCQNDPAWAVVDWERRWDIARNHTATHLLHSELRYILGEHVQQAGSLVTPDRLRFDFTHSSMLTQDELEAIERSVNEAILAKYPLEALYTDYKQAVDKGAIALFGEKYGDRVRVIKIGYPDEPFSQELCGGTHVNWTSDIGLFHIISESSIGAGLRRIEAVSGRAAQKLVQKRLGTLESAAVFLGCAPDEIDRRVLALLDEVQDQRKEISRLRREIARHEFEALLKRVQAVQGVKVLAVQVMAAEDMETLREMSDWFRDRLGSGVVVLGAVLGSKPNFVAAVTPDLVERGLHAGQLIKAVAQVVGGGGGGKPTLAQAGGHDISRLGEALLLVPDLVTRSLS